MKNFIILIIILLIFLFLSVNCTDSRKLQNREMLKEYFLYSCLKHGFENSQFLKEDHSDAVYHDLIRYDPEAIHIVDSIARQYVESIEPSNYEGRMTKGIIILSIEKYKSHEIEKFINSLDKFMLKD